MHTKATTEGNYDIYTSTLVNPKESGPLVATPANEAVQRFAGRPMGGLCVE